MGEGHRDRYTRWGLEALLSAHPDLRPQPVLNRELRIRGEIAFDAVKPGYKRVADSFDVELFVPDGFPDELPSVRDLTGRIPKAFHTHPDDRIVKQGDTCIPEEWKSSRRVSHGHRLQLGTYFLLIEDKYGVRPPYGVVVLGDGSRVKVPNTDALRTEVLSIAAMIREQRGKLMEPVPVSQPASKCRKCGQRANCGQASL